MIVKTEGIVLRTVNYSESSIIATIYTQALGVKSYLLRGVRSAKKNRQGNVFQPLQYLNLVVQNRENKNLQFVKEFKPSYVYKTLPYDIRKSAIGLFMLEVINSSVKEEEANEELFQFLKSSFVLLDELTHHFVTFHLQFLLQLTVYLGFQPMNNFSETNPLFALQEGMFVIANDAYPDLLSKGDSELFAQFINEPQMIVDKVNRKRILTIFEQYYMRHVSEFRQFKTPFVFEEIFG